MPPRSVFPFLSSAPDGRAGILQGLLIGAIAIAALHVGREVLMPLALAILLSFVLTPPLLMLRRIKVPRVLAVAIVVGSAFALIVALGWLMSREVTQLASDLPGYRFSLSEKIKSFRETTGSSPVLKRAGDVLSDLQRELATGNDAPAAPQVGTDAERPDDRPITVQVREPEPSPFEVYQRIAGTVLPPFATAGIVLLFVVFILIQREDLRDRLIRLLGSSDLQRATSTMTDAATRLSKFFLRQLLINTAYGALTTLVLWMIGIPTPIVWGVLAGLMRFVPFIGSYIAAIPPVLLALAIDPGWSTALLTFAVFVVGEMTMGQVVEPLIFGRGTGVSPLAVVVSTVFWTWMWGPIGLILAMPLTVCLAVLGRHVEGLQFFEILLGDKPALTPEQAFYRRALSGDAAEATYQAELSLKDQSLQSYLDTVALSGLRLAERDSRRGALDREEEERIEITVREMLDNLADFEPHRWFSKLRPKPEAAAEAEEGGLAALDSVENGEHEEKLPLVQRSELAPGWAVEEPILSIGGRNALDAAAADMLAGVLRKRGLGVKEVGPETISAGHITTLSGSEAKLVVLSYLGLGAGPAQIRYLVRRLRRILPKGTLVLVCYYAEADEHATARKLLEQADADAYAVSLPEAVELCIKAAKGELKPEADDGASVTAAPSPESAAAPAKLKRREPRGKSQTAVA
jgi:predicted PurR-regulated permease PerM